MRASVIPLVSLTAQVRINLFGKTEGRLAGREYLLETYVPRVTLLLDNRDSDGRSRVDPRAEILGKLRCGIMFLDEPVHRLPLATETSTALLERLARIEGVAHGLADEDQERQHDCDREESGQAEPWRLHIGLGLRQHFTQ